MDWPAVTSTDPGEIVPGTGPGILYVFLHGLICLIESRDRFLGVVVDMGDEHSYRVGDWLLETPITRGSTMQLTGVTPANAALDPQRITIVRRPLAAGIASQTYATVSLPKPKALHSLRRTNFPAGLVSGKAAADLNQTSPGTLTIAALHILEYDFAELADVALDGSPWGPPTTFRASRAATLHLFAEPEVVKSGSHQVKEFGKAAQLFTDFDVSISGTLAMTRLETAEYPADLSTSEALALLERRFILSSVAASYKDDTPGDLPAPSEGGSGGALCAPLPGEGL